MMNKKNNPNHRQIVDSWDHSELPVCSIKY